ncbi:MAG: CTP-dependent riboflavin kinase [Desulfobacterales bacterium]|nr:CTP-dependent riboflavin kinase [Desulfobacterales bacterium]
MNEKYTLMGKIVSGACQAAFFTQLDWVQEQCAKKLGFKPYPGTLNLVIADSDADLIGSLKGSDIQALIPPDPKFCSAQTLSVKIKGIQGAIIIPAEDVQIHAKNILEVIAPVCLKEVLGLDDGDIVKITIITQ